jgi:hypothetical protein
MTGKTHKNHIKIRINPMTKEKQSIITVAVNIVVKAKGEKKVVHNCNIHIKTHYMDILI